MSLDLLIPARCSMTAVRVIFYRGFVSKCSLWKATQDSCVNMTLKYSEISKERHRVEDVHNERRSGGHLILLPSPPCQIYFWRGALCQGIFYVICAESRLSISDLLILQTRQQTAHLSYVVGILLLLLIITPLSSLSLSPSFSIFPSQPHSESTSSVLPFCFSTHVFSCFPSVSSTTQHYLLHWPLILLLIVWFNVFFSSFT